MPIGPQPRGRRGDIKKPYSPLNLRLALALFGFFFCGAAAVVFLVWADVPGFGWLFAVLAAFALVDIVVVQLRRRARKRAGDTDHSMFE